MEQALGPLVAAFESGGGSGGSSSPTPPVASQTLSLQASPDQLAFVAPLAAAAYDYKVLSGSNVAGLVLPSLGDDRFEVVFADGGAVVTAELLAGVLFAFPGGGVDAFSVRGIEPAATAGRLAPGLSFAGAGPVSLLQTALPQAVLTVPEPGVLALTSLALAGLALRRGRTARDGRV